MKIKWLFLFPLVFALTAACTGKADNAEQLTPKASTVQEVIACGDDKVVIFSNEGNPAGFQNQWEWTAVTSKGLPEDYIGYFKTNDECKPIGEDRLLITSSGGGVALVERSTGNTTFYAHVPNAHSAEYLPGDRIAVALSTAEGGNAIHLYDIHHPDEVLFTDSLYSGHGVVWVKERESLFALGFDELREYKLKDWDTSTPKLDRVATWEIPDEGGHDLFLTTDKKLLLSTTNSVWQFDISTAQFSPFEPLEGIKHVKSINYNAETGELVYTKGEISWWTHHIYFVNPSDTLKVEDIKIYKARVR